MDVISPARRAFGATLAAARTRAAVGLRAKVAGDDADAAADDIWGARGERWFAPGDPVWQVHADASMFVGGIRALLLQSLHPLAMAGVAGHSGYKGDPWGRLQRTSHYIAITTFGTVEHAERVVDRVRRVHTTVTGTAADGRPYAASDPHLLAWVHAAEIDSFLGAYRAYGTSPIAPADADRYVEQAGHAASLLGVQSPPRSVAELEAVLDAYRPELEVTPAALEAADFLLRHPPLDLAARAGYGMLAAGAVATLPEHARVALGLPRLGAPGRVVGRTAVRSERWLLSDPAVANERRITAALAATDEG